MKVLSLNISAGNCSAWAPPGFTLQDKYRRILSLIEQHDPQLVSLQELNAQAASIIGSGMLSSGYQHCGSAESHCGSTHIWASSILQATPKPCVGPVAIAQIPLPLADGMPGGNSDAAGFFYFAGCHLEPFADGAPFRLDQIEEALRSMPPCARIVLAGDTNMRNAENTSVEKLGLNDAFKWAGSPKQHNFSWNSTINKYHGPEQRAYTARYDRIYLRVWACQDLQLIANEPVTLNHGDYLSDHFGLLGTLQLLPNQP